MLIGDVARRAGIAPSAIRFYESAGLIERAPRQNGRRLFEPEILDRLAIIELAKRAGFTITEIRRLLQGFSKQTQPGARWRALADNKLLELDRRIAQALRMKEVLRVAAQCECPTFEICAQAT